MKNGLIQKWFSITLTIAITFPIVSLAQEKVVDIENARHVKVFYEKGRYAGWPANNGIWKWGNEILVGFNLGYLMPPKNRDFHQIDPNRPQSNMLARSQDGGETWSVSKAGYPDGQLQPFPTDIAFDTPGFALNASDNKAFVSLNKGRNWTGPFRLPFADLNLRARTDYQVIGPNDLMLFLTAQKTNNQEGRAFCARTRTGGKYWNQFAWIGPELPMGFSIMPSSVRIPNGDFLVALRRHYIEFPTDHYFLIELFHSADGGLSWQWLANPVKIGLYNGNPPSMVRLTNGHLCTTYGNRDVPHTIRAVFSTDDGRTWGSEYVLRRDAGGPDIGYTRTMQRPDGKLVTIYYWLDEPRSERYIAATIWSTPKEEMAVHK